MNNIAQIVQTTPSGQTNNLLTNGQKVVQLGINATPGTEIYIGNSTTETHGILTIGSTGNFFMECEDFPITFISVKENKSGKKVIIDIMFR